MFRLRKGKKKRPASVIREFKNRKRTEALQKAREERSTQNSHHGLKQASVANLKQQNRKQNHMEQVVQKKKKRSHGTKKANLETKPKKT